MRLAVLLGLFGSVASFVTVSQKSCDALTRLGVLHRDPIIPEKVRAERSEWIRDKLIGEDEEEPQQPTKKSSRDKKPDTHPHLTQMIKVLEEHIVHEEPVDPNC